MHGINEYVSSRFFENEPSEICSHLSEKEPKDRFFAPDKLQNHTRNEKERRKKKSEEEERRRRGKSKGCFCRKKKLFDERGLFSSNVLNNPATSIHLSKFVKTRLTAVSKISGGLRRGQHRQKAQRQPKHWVGVPGHGAIVVQ